MVAQEEKLLLVAALVNTALRHTFLAAPNSGAATDSTAHAPVQTEVLSSVISKRGDGVRVATTGDGIRLIWHGLM